MSAPDSVRIHNGEYSTPRWRGALVDVAKLAESARDEVAARAADDAQRLGERVHVAYDDGNEDFASIAAFAEASTSLDPAKVRWIEISAGLYSPSGTVEYRFSLMLLNGLDFTARSIDRLWAHGLADVVREQAEAGELPPYQEKRRPLKWWEWLIGVLALALSIGLVVWASVDNEKDNPGTIALLVFAIFSVASLPLVESFDRRIPNPSLVLVRADEQDKETGRPDVGITTRAQAWIRRRPLLSLFLTAVFTLALNELSDRI